MKKYRLLWLVDGTYTTSDGVVVEDTKERWLEFFGCFMSPYYSISEFEFVEVVDEPKESVQHTSSKSSD